MVLGKAQSLALPTPLMVVQGPVPFEPLNLKLVSALLMSVLLPINPTKDELLFSVKSGLKTTVISK